MSLYIEAETDRPIGDGDELPPVDPEVAGFAASLREAYERRVDAYHRDLAGQFGAQPAGSAEPPVSGYPTIMLPAAEPGDEPEEIVIDAELFVTLFDLYTLSGWAPIASLDKVLAAKAGARGVPDQPSAGTPELKWVTAYRFFQYTRNTLALLIRDVLVDLERRAATLIIAQLSVTAATVSTTVTRDLQITRTGPRYTFGNTSLTTLLFEKVTEAVNQRAAWEALADSIGGYRDLLKTHQNKIDRKRRHGVRPRTFDLEESKRLTALIARKTDLRDATRAWYASMKTVIGTNVPLALLVVDSLKPGFDRAAFEQALGDAIFAIYGRLDGLGAGIDPEVSQVAAQLPGLTSQGASRIDLAEVQRLSVVGQGPERTLATVATAGLPGSPAWFPLLHGTTFRLLLHRGEIGVDSFEYVVMHHYLMAVDDVLDELAADDKAVKAFVNGFAKVAAALSIALLVTPLAEVAPALRGAATVADLALLAYGMYSAVDQLAQMDRAVTAQLLEPDAYGVSALGRIGELVYIRHEYAVQLTEQLVLELLAVIAGGQWEIARKLLITRGFIMDVGTLLDDGDGE